MRAVGKWILGHIESVALPFLLERQGRLILNMYRGAGTYVMTIMSLAYYSRIGDINIDTSKDFVTDKTIFSALDRRCLLDAIRGRMGIVCNSRLLSDHCIPVSSKVRVVARVRNPLDQLRSYSYYLHTLVKMDRKSAISLASDYCLNYFRMIDVLSNNDILVLKMEELNDGPDDHIYSIVRHLGLDIGLADIDRAIQFYRDSNIQKKARQLDENHPRISYKQKGEIFTPDEFSEVLDKISNTSVYRMYSN